MQTKQKQRLGTIIFLVGVFIALGLAGLTVWGDFEAMSYFFTGAGYPTFSGLSCPVLLTRGEVATVSVRLNNPSNEVIQPYYRVEISGIAGLRTLENQVPVAPHSSRTVQWTVSSQDVDLGIFVMVHMEILPMAGYSTREATCGAVVLNIGGLSGGQIVGGALVLGLLGIVLGLAITETGSAPVGGKDLSLRNGMRAAGVLVCLALFTALIGSWLFGTLFAVLTLLLLVILLRIAVT